MSCRSRARPISARAARTTPRPRCPEGSRALAGIGCHYMAQFMDRDDRDLHPDGRRRRAVDRPGAVHRDAARLRESRRRHLLPIPACWRSAPRSPPSVNITYKMLFNDAVAMTGGQPVDGGSTVPHDRRASSPPRACAQIVVVTDEPDKYPPASTSPPGVDGAPPRRARRGAARAARDRRASPRSSTTRPAPPRSAAAASAAAFPTRPSASSSTSWSARAAAIARRSRTACRSCRSRPSSAASARSTSRAATRITPASRASARASSPCMAARCSKRKPASSARTSCRRCPSRRCPALDEPYGILVTGVGGTGVVTIGALLGMAAHLEGKGCTVLDMTGLAQKGGAVYSHVRIAAQPGRDPCRAHRRRRRAPAARLRSRRRRRAPTRCRSCSPGHSRAIVNSHETITGDFTRNPDLRVPEPRRCSAASPRRPAPDNAEFIDATGSPPACSAIRSRPICSCSAMPSSAGWCRCRPTAIERAIELNGVAVEFNRQRLPLGPPRRASIRPLVEARATPRGAVPREPPSVAKRSTSDRRAASRS